MKNILNKDSNKVLVQGLGRDGSFQTEKCIEYGTEVVAGVHPTKAGENFKGIPIFGSVDEAVSQTSPDIGLIFVPAPFASDVGACSSEASFGCYYARPRALGSDASRRQRGMSRNCGRRGHRRAPKRSL